MYLAVSTRPDIAHAVSYLSQFNEDFDKDHWTAAKRVLKYLKGTINFGIEFNQNPSTLTGFVDSDWGGCAVDRRSYTGYVFLLNGGPISWDSKKQRTVALSSTEAEYMALSEATKKAIYLNEFLIELGFKEMTDRVLFNDNIGAKKLAENTTFHARSKHIEHTTPLCSGGFKRSKNHHPSSTHRRHASGYDDKGAVQGKAPDVLEALRNKEAKFVFPYGLHIDRGGVLPRSRFSKVHSPCLYGFSHLCYALVLF